MGCLMIQAIRKDVVIQHGGRIQFDSSELKEGMHAEVIVILKESPSRGKLASFIGQGKGAFDSSDAVDLFLRTERESWE